MNFIIKKSLFFILISFVIYISSCEIINPEEEIPAYLEIDSIKLQTNEEEEGSNSQNITDVWIYVNTEFTGTYELPAKFPVITRSGNNEIIIKAGIKNNGISATRTTYPFYTSFTLDTALEPEKTFNISPGVNYKDITEFCWIENFDGIGLTIEETNESDTSLKIKDAGYEGKSGAIYLESDKTFYEFKTKDSLYLDYTSPVYLEMDYKNNHVFVVGLYVNKSSTVQQTIVIYVNPHPYEWNKIYIDLSDKLKSYPSALHYNIFVGINKTENSDVDNIYVFLDNIKLISW